MQIADYIDADLLDKFEFHNYNHANRSMKKM